MSGKRNVSICRGHELANALYTERPAPFNFVTSSHRIKAIVMTLRVVNEAVLLW